MTVRTLVQLQSDIDTNFADNLSASITPSKARTVMTNLVDTAIDRWTNTGVSPQYNNGATAIANIASLLANNTAGDISPADLRDSVLAEIDDNVVFKLA